MEQTLLGIVNAIVIYMYVQENSLENQEVVGLIFMIVKISGKNSLHWIVQ